LFIHYAIIKSFSVLTNDAQMDLRFLTQRRGVSTGEVNTSMLIMKARRTTRALQTARKKYFLFEFNSFPLKRKSQ